MIPIDDYARLVTLRNPLVLVGAVGCALWLAAYAAAIARGLRQKTYAIPLVAIALNVAWEALFAFVMPAYVSLWKWFEVGWFGLDLALIYTLLRFGRAEQVVPALRRHFVPVCAGAVAVAFVGELTFVRFVDDRMGFASAYVVNLVMSLGFLARYLAHPEGRWVSRPVAWLKFLGTCGTTFQSYFLLPQLFPGVRYWGFFHFLYAACFVFDALYVALVQGWIRGDVTPTPGPTTS